MIYVTVHCTLKRYLMYIIIYEEVETQRLLQCHDSIIL